MKYELIHDTIAKELFDNKASEEAKTRLKIKKLVQERLQAYEERGSRMTRDDLNFIKPYLSTMHLSEAEQAFVTKAETQLKRKRNQFRILVISVFVLLTTLLIWAIGEKINGDKQYKAKLEEERKTIAARDTAQANLLAANALLMYNKDNNAGFYMALQAYDTLATKETARAIHDILSDNNTQISRSLGASDDSFFEPSRSGRPGQSYNPITQLALSKNGNEIYTGHEDKYVRFWKSPYMTPYYKHFADGPIKAITTSSDGNIYIGTNNSATILQANGFVRAVLQKDTVNQIPTTKIDGFGRARFVDQNRVVMIESPNGELMRWLMPSKQSTKNRNGRVDLLVNKQSHPALGFGAGKMNNNLEYQVIYRNLVQQIWDQQRNLDLKRQDPFVIDLSEEIITDPSDEKEVASAVNSIENEESEYPEVIYVVIADGCMKNVISAAYGKLYFTDCRIQPNAVISEITEKSHQTTLQKMSYSNDMRLLMGIDANQAISIWDADQKAPIFSIEDLSSPIVDFACDNVNGKVVVATKDQVHIWYPWDKKRVHRSNFDQTSVRLSSEHAPDSSIINLFYETYDTIQFQSQYIEVKKPKDEQYLIAAKPEGDLEVWRFKAETSNVKFEKIHELKGHEDAITSMFFDHLGYLITTSTIDVSIRVWDYKNGFPLWTIKTYALEVKLSDDGRKLLLFGDSDDSTVEVLDYHLDKWVTKKRQTADF